jgi:AraC-like DNA-binding protein
MKKTAVTVHKQTVMANRIGFRIWAGKNNKNALIPQLESQYVNLDEYTSDRVPLEIITREVRLAAELAQEANLGLAVIDLIDIRITSLGRAIQQVIRPLQQQQLALPVEVLLHITGRYFQVLSEVVAVDVCHQREGICMTFSPRMPDIVSYHQVEGAVYGLVRLVAHFNQRMPDVVRFSHVPDALNYDMYLQCFDCLPDFAADQTQLIYQLQPQQEVMSLPLLLSPVIHLHEKQFPDLNYSERIRLLLNTILGVIEPTRDNIANIMNLSVSSLQRRLKQDQVSYHQLLLEVRLQRVKEYIHQPGMTSEKLAFLLGYKAKSQFLKAFRQWFGKTPQQFRCG